LTRFVFAVAAAALLAACAAPPPTDTKVAKSDMECIRGEAPLGSSIPRRGACVKISDEEREALQNRLNARPAQAGVEPGAR
jgi:hypothetical protein